MQITTRLLQGALYGSDAHAETEANECIERSWSTVHTGFRVEEKRSIRVRRAWSMVQGLVARKL